MGKERESANLVSTLTGIAVTISGDPVVLGIGSTEHLRISAAGYVGINESSPIHQLSVGINTSTAWDSTKNISNTTNNDFIGLNLDNADSGANPEVGIMLQAGASNIGQYTINCLRTGSNTADLIFRTRDGGSASKEQLRITSAGRLGIGTDNPGSFLHVEGDNANTLFRLKRTDAPAQILNDFGSGDSALKYTVNNASSYILGVDDSDADRFKLSYGSSDNAAFGTNDLVSVTTAGNLEVDSGDLTLNGNLVGAINVTVADDAFASITPPRDGGGWVFLTTRGQGSTYPWSTGYAFAYMDWGASAQVSAASGGASVATNTGGPPTGTTGADEKVTIFLGGTAGTLYLENRLGDTYSFQLTFI